MKRLVWWRWAIYGALLGASTTLGPLALSGHLDWWNHEPFLGIWLRGAAKAALVAVVVALACNWIRRRSST